ncbi:MAG: HAD-like domain-containing protein [Linnemannia gamsii]|nr:MAG: HAD-like domain-containing protein [Linnemannia gamsii]
MSQPPTRSVPIKPLPVKATSKDGAWTAHRGQEHQTSSTTITTTTTETNQTPVYYNASTKTFYPSTPIRAITPSYSPLALQDPVTVTKPRTLLVVLDLNGTLFYRAKNNKRNVTPRPHLQAFLDFIFEHCRVMVWSSAQPHSVDAMLSCGFGDRVPRLDRVWTRKDFRLSEHDYNKKVLTIKDLEFIWDAIKTEKASTAKKGATIAAAAAPTKGAVNHKQEKPEEEPFDQTNTVLIDDSFDKVQLQPYNGVQLLDFDEDLAKAGTDNELLKVRRYLEKLIYQKNVSAYMRIHPFDSNAPLHEDDVNVAKKNDDAKNAKEADELADLASRLEKSTL